MDNSNVVNSTTTVAPATTFAILVTLNTEEWPAIVEAKANCSWTAAGSEKRVACIIALRRHRDGDALVSYQYSENERDLSSFAVMAKPKTTDDAIDWVCAHLLANASDFWKPLVASFREKYAASPAMKAPPCIVYKGYNFNTIFLNDGIRVRVGKRPPSVSSGQ